MTKPVQLTDGSGPATALTRLRVVIACIVVIGVAGFVALSYQAGQARLANSTTPQLPRPGLDRPETAFDHLAELTVAPEALQHLTPDQARTWNARLPFSAEPLRSAPRFIAPVDSVNDYNRAVDCLAAAIFYEAGNESLDGRLAVAQVVLNRVRHPAFPKTVCGVVFEGSQRRTGCQFTFTCDGAMARMPSEAAWASAVAVAEAALNGMVSAKVGAATHYHATYVAPYWAPRLLKLAEIGAHVFYRFPGSWSASSALVGRYGGVEPAIASMSHFARTGPQPPLPPVEGEGRLQSPVIVIGRIELPALDAPVRNSAILETPSPSPDAGSTTPAQAAAPAPPVVQNPLTVSPVQPRRSRIARPGDW